MWPDDNTPEPAAWINFNAATSERNVSFFCESELASIPLWPEPPSGQRKPLTEEEIERIANSVRVDSVYAKKPTWHIRLIRAIEKAHGIGP
jgi:hypothetical protein